MKVVLYFGKSPGRDEREDLTVSNGGSVLVVSEAPEGAKNF